MAGGFAHKYGASKGATSSSSSSGAPGGGGGSHNIGKDIRGDTGAGTSTCPDGFITQELHNKMSKKVAQLTKVIYHLNTKNDEYEQKMRYMDESTQKRMAAVEAECLETVARYRDEIRRLKDTASAEEQLNMLRAEVDAERESAVSQFEAFKAETERKENRCRHSYILYQC